MDPLAGGDFYPGDLLATALRVEREYWIGREDQRGRLWKVIEGIPEVPEEVRDALERFRQATIG